MLATSREVLHLTGEARLRVEPLPVPRAGARDVAASPAVQLLADRARATRPGFELTPETAPLAAELSRRLDGLPLAIELAAAHVGALGLLDIASIVERRLSRLVEWSYDPLQPDEQTILHAVAAQRGATLASLLAAAAEHGLDGARVAAALGSLADKSVVAVSFPDGDARYDVLTTVREYVLGRPPSVARRRQPARLAGQRRGSGRGDASSGERRKETS